MLSKYWKKIGMFILIIACVFNIMSKWVRKISLKDEMITSATYALQHENDKNEIDK